VAKLLELPHFVEQHRVPEMQVRCRRIEAGLDAQRLTSTQLADQLVNDEHLLGTPLELRQLGLEISHSRTTSICNRGTAAAQCIDRAFAARVGFVTYPVRQV